ncbi:rab-GTPase-TBC domain-domain-containing protein [Clohesyomyces aquaticus]|uniref:Rab-GTPase-TBC domain-domain-containing protein n=1 Tax=Clohesyomyces aquaticus TaxID=1231657 RepID=A0A1Y1ZTG3_9PLEO|nr:rab-GTPase-TBC domain-domain-containing protein [Clohesyomyces aquaticus]
MAGMESPSLGAVDLVRTSSQNSTASSSRKNNGTVRVKPAKRTSNASLQRAPSPAADTKSLTSFPSLSPTPDSSPVQSRVNGWFRAAVGAGGPGERERERDGENIPIPTSSPETVKAMAPPEVPKPAGPSSTIRKVTKSTQQIVGSLVAVTPSARERSALFDDTPQEPDKVPGNLHYSSSQDIEDMLERTGAVTLVRQLAGDLAQRDAQITALRRRAEERERILRKMLQECEVSNMDIENRLRVLDKSRADQSNGGNGLTRAGGRGSAADLPGMHPEDPIGQRLARAIEDEISEFPDAMGYDAGDNVQDADADAASIDSTSELPRDTGRSNWKSYLWNGPSRKSSRAPSVASRIDRDAEAMSVQTRSRASSGAKAPRKPISNDLFVPPGGLDKGAVPTLRRLQSQDRESGPSSRRSSVSLTNWALKMVAGNSQATRSSDKVNTTRGRKFNLSDPADREASMESTRTSQSARTASAGVQKRGGRTALGPNGTIKSITTENAKAVAAQPSPQLPNHGLSNLGPVEMDRILPEESRPPTLLQHHNNFQSNNEYLTDRFGFIYDQRRKKRQSEAAAALTKQKRSSNVESLGDTRTVLSTLAFDEGSDNIRPLPSNLNDGTKSPPRPGSASSGDQGAGQPSKTWQDYLKLATFPTELLSHTPSAAPITLVQTPQAEAAPPKLTQLTVAKRGSMPSTSANPEPAPSRILSGNAEFAVLSSSAGPASPISPHPHQADPVKALLEQLTELHDSLQRDKTIKWNEFLRKVRAERKREGETISTGEGRPKGLAMPETLLTDGELIGVAGLGNKGKIGRAKWNEFRRLVLGGIPVVYRAKIWAESSGASTMRIPGYYEDLVHNGDDNPSIIAQIQMDINRTLTDNIFFRKGPGVHKLNEVLLAYSRRNPEVGYCQGMNLITACLLLIMPTAEDAFWVLATMIENILPQKYYDQQLLTSRADQSVLRSYVVELLPKLSAHLDALEIELEALTFQWFLSVFTDCLSAEALFRVWDVVLCMHDGSTFLFQVALALLKLNERQLLGCDTPAGVYHYINHQMTNHAISIDGLIQASDALNKVVKRKDVEERREKAVRREQEVMQEREMLRRERKKLRALQQDSSSEAFPDHETQYAAGSSTATATMAEAVSGDKASLSASLDAELSRHTSPMRTPLSRATSRSEEEEDAEALNQSLEELVTRTPVDVMVEEERGWRA